MDVFRLDTGHYVSHGDLKMNKIPYVERDSMSGGIKGECAYLWCAFLANEADMNDDIVELDKWKYLLERLKPEVYRPMVSSVHIAELEDVIERWTNGKRD